MSYPKRSQHEFNREFLKIVNFNRKLGIFQPLEIRGGRVIYLGIED